MEFLINNDITDVYTSFDYADKYYKQLQDMFNEGLKNYIKSGFLLLKCEDVNNKLKSMPTACRKKLHSLMPQTMKYIFNKSMSFMSRC